jgi:hypothetical protein
MSPDLMKILIGAVGGWALTFGWTIGADWFRRRGARRLKAAEAGLAKAKLTPDEKDDLIAGMALERAREDAEFMAWLADHIEKNKPVLPFPGK